MPYANRKWFKSQGNIKVRPPDEWMSLLQSQSLFKSVSKLVSPLMHRALTWPQVGRLDFWDLLFPVSWRFAIFLVSSTIYLPSTGVLDVWDLEGGGTEEESVMFQWLRLQWQMHTPSQFSSREVKTGQVKASACSFPSAVKPGLLECACLRVYHWK